MECNLKIGCIVMAAGNARRFGSNKLTAALRGRSLIRRALEAVPAEQFDSLIVVTQYSDIAEVAKGLHFTAVCNEHPDLGISHTIELGLTALGECDGVLFLVSDQPLLRRESVAALVEFWRARPTMIAALGHGGVRGNPCLFPARFFPELMALTGDRGGSAVIQQHQEDLVLLEVDARELADVDTVEAMDNIRKETKDESECIPL